jgi:hypothetical protein
MQLVLLSELRRAITVLLCEARYPTATGGITDF